MAKLPLSQTVDASRAERSWRSSVLSLITSTLVQGLAIAALIVTPLLVSQSLPAPAHRLKLPDVVVPVAPPPRDTAPEPSSKPKTRRRSDAFPRIPTSGFVHPIEIDIDLGDEAFAGWSEHKGVPGGVPSGMPGAPPPPAPEPIEPKPDGPVDIEIGGDIRPPRKIVHVNPVYPAIAREARIEGTVTLRAILDAYGNVVDLRVIQSVPLLDGAAIDAVQRWKYEPTYLNGSAVAVVMSIQVEFKLR